MLGSIGQPYLGEVFVGHAGGARLVTAAGETPLKVRTVPAAERGDHRHHRPRGLLRRRRAAAPGARCARAARLARLGCDAYAYAMVALGTIDLVVEAGLKSWDVEAAVPVIAGAGGLVTDWRGDPIGRHGGQMAIAGDRALLDEALVALRRAAK